MNPHRKIIVSVLLFVLVGAIAGVAVGQQRSRQQPPRPRGRPAPEDLQVTSDQLARIQVDAFELICSQDRLADLDLDELTADVTTPAELLAKLDDLGTARALFRADERFASGKAVVLRSSSRVPFVQSYSMHPTGERMPNIQYHNVGYVLNFSGFWSTDAPELAFGNCQVEVSGLIPRVGEAGTPVERPIFQDTKLDKRFMAQDGQPVYSMASNIPVAAQQGVDAHVLIIRMVMSR